MIFSSRVSSNPRNKYYVAFDGLSERTSKIAGFTDGKGALTTMFERELEPNRRCTPILTLGDVSIIENERQLVIMVGSGPPSLQQSAGTDVQVGGHYAPAQGQGPGPHRLPLFFNELGVPSIQVGVTAFHCMGVMPPHDHPHVYLNMGAQTDLLRPYCSTGYVLNPALRETETNPAHFCAVNLLAA